MTAPGWLPAPAEEVFGADATAEESYDLLTVDVPPASWITALETARDRLGCTYFDWLSAVDEPGTGFRVCAHLVALSPVRRLLVRTTVPHDAPVLPSAVDAYAGAAWHERETHEMFGVRFTGHPGLDHLLLPENFEGHPLRKDFVLAARVAKAWPGAKEPGESEHGGPKRRQMLPPGVPDPNDWGPLKGQLPPAPARPARGAATSRAAGERPARPTGPAGERPPRRMRSASAGSASQTTTPPTPAPTQEATPQQAPATERRAPRDPANRPETATAGEAVTAPGATPDAAAEPQTVPEPAADPRAVRDAVAEPPAEPRTTAAETAETAEAAEAAEAAAADGTEGAAGAGEAAGAVRPGGTRETGGADRPAAPEPEASRPSRGPRRARSASQGSASQRAATSDGPPSEKAPTGDATTEEAAAAEAPAEGPAPGASTRRARPPRSSDAPWHHARPAFDDSEPQGERTAADRPQSSGGDPRDGGSPEDATPEDRTPADPPADGTHDTPRGGPQ
ncbi:NADH-quinone oxidoreductase subunit C [Streptomyces sp. BK239]|uniref:NADH-quinone oxidoreductase subunit C n=1 Tax=Streptomyces sp. BK239 TaxID=2512155 RepID=UPI00102AABFF|nr:NADH-quinone oxidoreductase subunit C [Streptomyces sp. BK239]RZU17010.1 NADH:ubiquinone oxidoreductase subunit C [Streptomyces sp. BK239]